MDENPDQLSFFPGSDDESKKRKDNNKKRKVNNNKKIKQNENKTNKLEQTNEINHSIIMINNNSQIKIVSHDAPGEIMAGEKKILVVIKGSPFTFRITRNNDPNLDFRYMALSSILIYDQMNERQVGYLKKMPLETKTSLSEDGSFIDLESRISVLSSQHEDMAFRIKIVALNPDNGLPFDQNILLYTDPIRVVSKPEQVRKKESKSSTNDQKSKAVSKNDQSINVAIEIKNKQDSHLEFVSQLLTHTGNNNNQNYGMPNNNFNNNYNNNNNFNMNNNMNNMNNNNFNNNFNNNNNNNFNMNNNNSTLMNSFFNNQNNNGNNNSLNNNLFNDPFSNTFNNNNIFTNQLNQYANNNNAQKEDTFESVFLDFVNCYASLDHQDKSNNIRRIIKTSSQKELETLSELSDLIASECNFTITEKKDKLYICNCKDCIYKKELSQVDSFYRDWDVN